MTIIVTRAQWGARPPKDTPARVNIAARTATCAHYAGGTHVTLSTFDQACAYVRADQNYHMDHNHWDDIGYNFLVASAPDYPAIDGLIFEGRGRDVIGAHVYGHNTPWIGVQVAIGGNQAPSPKALASVRYLHDTFVVAAGHGLEKVGHKDGSPTQCPGALLYAWVHAGMPSGSAPTDVRGHVAMPVTKVTTKDVAKAPAFPLQRGWYFGPKSGPAQSVSGYYGHRADLRRWQQRMADRGWAITVDGLYGHNTAAVAHDFQRQVGLGRDRLIGAQTWSAAWTATVT